MVVAEPSVVQVEGIQLRLPEALALVPKDQRHNLKEAEVYATADQGAGVAVYPIQVEGLTLEQCRAVVLQTIGSLDRLSDSFESDGYARWLRVDFDSRGFSLLTRPAEQDVHYRNQLLVIQVPDGFVLVNLFQKADQKSSTLLEHVKKSLIVP